MLYLFDATRLAPRHGLIRIGTGWDAANVSIATIFGAAKMEQINIFVECLDDEEMAMSDRAVSTTAAIST